MRPERPSPSLLTILAARLRPSRPSDRRKPTAEASRWCHKAALRWTPESKVNSRTRSRLSAFQRPRAINVPSCVARSTTSPSAGWPSTRMTAASSTQGWRPKKGLARLGLRNTVAVGSPWLTGGASTEAGSSGIASDFLSGESIGKSERLFSAFQRTRPASGAQPACRAWAVMRAQPASPLRVGCAAMAGRRCLGRSLPCVGLC